MFRRPFQRAALACLLGLVAGGFARSQEPAWNAPQSPYEYDPYAAPARGVLAPSVPRPKRFGCWATHQGFGCGSLKSDCNFIFGSCRTYFGEACRKGPPPPYPPGFLQPGSVPSGSSPSGYDARPAGGCNCW